MEPRLWRSRHNNVSRDANPSRQDGQRTWLTLNDFLWVDAYSPVGVSPSVWGQDQGTTAVVEIPGTAAGFYSEFCEYWIRVENVEARTCGSLGPTRQSEPQRPSLYPPIPRPGSPQTVTSGVWPTCTPWLSTSQCCLPELVSGSFFGHRRWIHLHICRGVEYAVLYEFLLKRLGGQMVLQAQLSKVPEMSNCQSERAHALSSPYAPGLLSIFVILEKENVSCEDAEFSVSLTVPGAKSSGVSRL